MSNHIHLFLRTLLPNISEAMYKVSGDYSHYFNKRYERAGHLFESRFKSKLVQEDRYFLGLLRYVHMNPVKAGMAAAPEQYAWRSLRAILPVSQNCDLRQRVGGGDNGRLIRRVADNKLLTNGHLSGRL